MFKNSEAVIILGVFTPDSRKSLSPVINISAPAMIAALKIGRSFISRIFSSSSNSSVGVEATIKSGSVSAKKCSNSGIWCGNLRLKIRRNSSIFWSQIIPVFGNVTALQKAKNGLPSGFRAADIRMLESINIFISLLFRPLRLLRAP